MTITRAMIARTKKFEGTLPHMYLDTKGKVTVGTGHMIRTATAAEALVMKVRGTTTAATVAQKNADHVEVAKQTTGYAATWYKQFTKLDMEAKNSDALLEADLAAAETGLKGVFPKYANFPAAAQEALVDMAYNLGIAGLKKFEKLIDACKAADWKTAAAECKRGDIPQERNDEIKALFEGLDAKLGILLIHSKKKVAAKKVATKRKTAAAKPSPRVTVVKKKAPAKKAAPKKTVAKKPGAKKPARKRPAG